MRFSKTVWLASAVAALLVSPVAASDFGGGSGAATPSAHLSVDEAVGFGKQIERELASKGAVLAMVFRSGRPRDQLPEGVSYTHGGFWVYQPLKATDGRTLKGYAVYNLYHMEGDQRDKSHLVQDFPLDFIRGTSVDDAGIIIPSPEMQRRILKVMASPAYQKLHHENYALVANPFNATYQNCNEFMLDVIAAALWQTDDYAQIKTNLKAHFKPTVIKASGFKRFVGGIADPRMRTDDHGRKIETVTYESLARFLKDNGLLQDAYVLDRAPVRAAPTPVNATAR